MNKTAAGDRAASLGFHRPIWLALTSELPPAGAEARQSPAVPQGKVQ